MKEAAIRNFNKTYLKECNKNELWFIFRVKVMNWEI